LQALHIMVPGLPQPAAQGPAAPPADGATTGMVMLPPMGPGKLKLPPIGTAPKDAIGIDGIVGIAATCGAICGANIGAGICGTGATDILMLPPIGAAICGAYIGAGAVTGI
jgi:hypothetical protein